MRKITQKPYLSILFLFGFLILFPIHIHAKTDELSSINIYVQIHENGDATIIEKRKVHLTTGTENFIPIGNLSNSKIIDFKVMEDDITYEFIENWDALKTQADKKYKNGILEVSSGYELVWGIGEYGDHEYTLEYTVTDFIKELEDAQVLFWRFVNDRTNIPPKKVIIEIEAPAPLTNENNKIWAFGFEGEINFVDGKVISESNKQLKSDHYATVLIQFPENTFSTKDDIDKTFAEIKNEALKGSNYQDQSPSITFTEFVIIAAFVILPFAALIFLLVIIVRVVSKLTRTIRRSLLFKKVKRVSNGQYNRELPYEFNIIDLFYLLEKMKLSNHQSLITSFFLRWIHEDIITIETKTKRLIRKKEYTALKFNQRKLSKPELEETLYQTLYKASGVQRTLSPFTPIRLSNKNRKQMKKWQKDMTIKSKEYLFTHGYLEENKSTLTTKGKTLERNIYMFIHYLKDFSLIHEREAIEVNIWDELLIWASVFDIADVVMKEFENIYPDYTTHSSYSSISTVHTVSALSRYTLNASNESSSSVRSSGGGGFTSTGGGSGSFGGGSGGGTR